MAKLPPRNLPEVPFTRNSSLDDFASTPKPCSTSSIAAALSHSFIRRRAVPVKSVSPSLAAAATASAGKRSGHCETSILRGSSAKRFLAAASGCALAGSSPETSTSEPSAFIASQNAAPDQSPSTLRSPGDEYLCLPGTKKPLAVSSAEIENFFSTSMVILT